MFLNILPRARGLHNNGSPGESQDAGEVGQGASLLAALKGRPSTIEQVLYHMIKLRSDVARYSSAALGGFGLMSTQQINRQYWLPTVFQSDHWLYEEKDPRQPESAEWTCRLGGMIGLAQCSDYVLKCSIDETRVSQLASLLGVRWRRRCLACQSVQYWLLEC